MKPWIKALFPVVFFFIIDDAHAQYGLGGGLDYNVDVKRVGLFLRGTTRVDSLWRAAGTFNLFFENGSKATRWELALDAHRYFWGDERRRAYLIGGLNLYHEHYSSRRLTDGEVLPPRRKNNVGVNLGGGLEMPVSERVTSFGEAKVSVGDGSLFGIFVGFQYRIDRKGKG